MASALVPAMKRMVVALVVWAPPALASLTPSEAEQVRHDVAVVQGAPRVRALVARPDLTASEAAAVMSDAMTPTPLDAAHETFLRELVFGESSAASRPVLAVAVVRGVLSRVDALLAQPPFDLDRNRPALAEMTRAYALIEEVVAAPERDNVTSSARADCAQALTNHVARHPAVLRPDAPVGPGVAVARAQVAIALLDALPTTPARRVDAAIALALEGARRAALIESGVLVLDPGGSAATVSSIRALLHRLPGARAAVEAIVVGDEHASLRGREAEVLAVGAPPGNLSDEDTTWGAGGGGPAVAATTVGAARALASVAVDRALESHPQLRLRVDQDGGPAGPAKLVAMLALDAARTLDFAAAHSSEGDRETAAWLSDALGALAVFASPSTAAQGLTLELGGSGGGDDPSSVTHITLDAAGSASAFRLGAHNWRIARGADGKVGSLRRDGMSVRGAALSAALPALSAGPSWRGAGVVFARLAGSPRVAIAAGPRIHLVGSGASDAVATPAPGDDVAVDAELRVEGGAAGIVVRAVPTASGFKGVSVVVRPGPTPQAVLLLGNGAGEESLAAPAVTLAKAETLRVHIVARGRLVEATLGSAKFAATVSDEFAHGDVALRASSRATLDAAAWRVDKP